MNNFEVTSFLADSVELVQGKIYGLGIGWDNIVAKQFPFQQSRIGLGLLVKVPFTETNKEHQLVISLTDQDGKLINNLKFSSQFNLGRPQQLREGDSQTMPIAINFDSLVFEKADTYRWVIEIDGKAIGGNTMTIRSM